MDTLQTFSSMIDSPLKVNLLKSLKENEVRMISFNEIMDLLGIGFFSAERMNLVTIIWEMYNDDLLIKWDSKTGTLFELTEKGKELSKDLYNYENR